MLLGIFIVLFVAILMLQQLNTDAGGFDRFQASLLNLLLFLFPLFILTIGAMSIAADIESGWYQLIRSYPVSIAHYLGAKYVALVSIFLFALATTEAVILIVGAFFGGVHIDSQFIVLTTVIIVVFSAISVMIGAFSIHRLQALGFSLGLWAVFTLLSNYVVMAIGTIIPKHVYEKIIYTHVHINIIEWLRYIYLIQIEQTGILGKSFYYLSQFYETSLGIGLIIGITILWWLIPLCLAYFKLKRKESYR
ncbi:ABC transporter permease [Lysinibacillus fusiformis]|uniref:ABC transporter permease n=1 Tax=Lysinibacillus TaxID=400634 RepID=UPI001FB15E50|nr:ABC transporter permease subunit [Lysinibacillus fusiformis]